MAEEIKINLDSDLDEKVAKLIGDGDDPMKAAEAIAEIARATGPVVSGGYVGGISAQKTKRGARVLASDPNSAHIEFGVPSLGIPAQFVLRRAVDAAGLKFKKRGA